MDGFNTACHNWGVILEIVGSNFVLSYKRLNIEATKPFRLLGKNDRVTDLRAFVKDVRTFFTSQSLVGLRDPTHVQDQKRKKVAGPPRPSDFLTIKSR